MRRLSAAEIAALQGATVYEMRGHLTVAQLAAFLCVKPATVRKMASRDKIEPVGKNGRANLYDAKAFVLAVGVHDRSVARKRRRPVSHLGNGRTLSE